MEITLGGNGAAWRLTELSGAGGYDKGIVAARSTGGLSVAEAAEVARLAEAAGLAPGGLTFRMPEGPDRVICVDGTQYMVEAVVPEGFAAATRHECDLLAEIGPRALLDTLGAIVDARFTPDLDWFSRVS